MSVQGARNGMTKSPSLFNSMQTGGRPTETHGAVVARARAAPLSMGGCKSIRAKPAAHTDAGGVDRDFLQCLGWSTWFTCSIRDAKGAVHEVGGLRFEGTDFTFWERHSAFVEVGPIFKRDEAKRRHDLNVADSLRESSLGR